jgi:hypothetical protein
MRVDRLRLDLRVVPLVERLRTAGAAEDLVALLVEYEGTAIADAAKTRINILTEAADEIDRLRAELNAKDERIAKIISCSNERQAYLRSYIR